MYGSTCFGRFLANHQELTTALAASGFTHCHKKYCILSLHIKIKIPTVLSWGRAA
jgi:hypothetical protein